MSLKVLSPTGFCRNRSIIAVLVAVVAVVVLLAELVAAGPVNPSVQRGNVTITQQGNDFVITASDGSEHTFKTGGEFHLLEIEVVYDPDRPTRAEAAQRIDATLDLWDRLYVFGGILLVGAIVFFVA